ncbi:MAG: 16S rRNA (adenine(1518)-N(6)/adenine(1519)-N(6))-dimethyltransferase RsmA [Gemmatimonadota bacterium]
MSRRPPPVERAKRSLGQNFLVDPNLQRKVVEALEAEASDTVLEIGPGHGELSSRLLGRVSRLVLVEKDDALAADLRRRWGDREDVNVVWGDALRVELEALLPRTGAYRLLSNLPYNVASPLLFRFLELRPAPARMLVTVQREVAARITARPGTKTYGALSVGVQARATAEVVFPIARKAFRPVPEVDSAVVLVLPDAARLADLPGPALRRLTRAAFSRRRKQWQKILREAPEYGLGREVVERLFRELDLDPRARPETLPPERFVELARALEGV